uniref:Uncharacterized protein n=1 Tax=Callithrix jacchus TaxID=9483 RepID=A0A8I3WRT3_CALJA
MRNFAWEIKLDLELADRESEAWDIDHSLGWQGNSVPEDRTEAGIKRFLEDTTDDGELSKMTRSMWALQPSPTKSPESP